MSDADKSKPAPDVFEAALAQLNEPANAAIAVGDTRFDVEAANRIGVENDWISLWPRC